MPLWNKLGGGIFPPSKNALDEIRNNMYLPLMKKVFMEGIGGRHQNPVFIYNNIFCPLLSVKPQRFYFFPQICPWWIHFWHLYIHKKRNLTLMKINWKHLFPWFIWSSAPISTKTCKIITKRRWNILYTYNYHEYHISVRSSESGLWLHQMDLWEKIHIVSNSSEETKFQNLKFNVWNKFLY